MASHPQPCDCSVESGPLDQVAVERLLQSPLLRAIADATPGRLAILDSERRIVYANESFVRGSSARHLGELIGKRIGNAIRCEQAESGRGDCGATPNCRFCGAHQAVLAAQSGRFSERIFLTNAQSNGALTPVEFSVQAKPLPSAGQHYVICALSDVSLQQKQHALERTFFHDILNTAGALVSLSETLLAGDTSSPSDSLELTWLLHAGAQQLVDEVRSHQLLVNAQNNDLDVVCQEIDLVAVVRQLVHSAQRMLPQSGPGLQVTTGESHLWLQTDATLVARVVTNLIRNAIEASSSSDVVTVQVRREAEWSRIDVANPAYLRPEVQAHIFKRSFSTKGAGRGVGTYSVKLLTERYLAGQASFVSDPGAGTCFTVRLPLHLNLRTLPAHNGYRS